MTRDNHIKMPVYAEGRVIGLAEIPEGSPFPPVIEFRGQLFRLVEAHSKTDVLTTVRVYGPANVYQANDASPERRGGLLGSFMWAMLELQDGRRVRRAAWPASSYVQLDTERRPTSTGAHGHQLWAPDTHDLNAFDWSSFRPDKTTVA